MKFGATPEIVTGTRLLSYRRELCALLCSPLLAHSEPLFIHLKILQFKKFEHNLLPSISNHMFVYNRDVHQVNTRQADKVRPSKYRTVVASKSLRISAVGIWNDVLTNLDVNLSFFLFKKRLFEYFLH